MALRKKADNPVPVALEFHHRNDNSSGDRVRVWRNDWSGDMFEILDFPSFSRFRTMLKRFNVPIVDKNGDD